MPYRTIFRGDTWIEAGLREQAVPKTASRHSAAPVTRIALIGKDFGKDNTPVTDHGVGVPGTLFAYRSTNRGRIPWPIQGTAGREVFHARRSHIRTPVDRAPHPNRRRRRPGAIGRFGRRDHAAS